METSLFHVVTDSKEVKPVDYELEPSGQLMYVACTKLSATSCHIIAKYFSVLLKPSVTVI